MIPFDKKKQALTPFKKEKKNAQDQKLKWSH